MKCIIVDDEPLARQGIEILLNKSSGVVLLGSFSNAGTASQFLSNQEVDLVFLDIQMPGVNGIEFAKTIKERTLIIFTTAYSEFALESYEVEAIDYLIKPVRAVRFHKAIAKAHSYIQLLEQHSDNQIQTFADEYFFVKADRKIYKVFFRDIRYIEGLKDYVIIHYGEQKIITAMNIKTIHEQMPKNKFFRISKSYIINVDTIDSFDNNTVFIGNQEIPIGNAYRNTFFEEFVSKKMFGR